jgi:septal ring factor EnvC (AmiA/AmiB activator)
MNLDKELRHNISSMEEQIIALRDEIKKLRDIITQINCSCQRMDNHIGFIHSTYNAVRKPFALTLNVINRTLGNGKTTPLPQLTDSV